MCKKWIWNNSFIWFIKGDICKSSVALKLHGNSHVHMVQSEFSWRKILKIVWFPLTSEVAERFEKQHMWQMGSKLESPWLLHFHSALSLQIYAASQMEAEKKCAKLNVYNAFSATVIFSTLYINLLSVFLHFAKRSEKDVLPSLFLILFIKIIFIMFHLKVCKCIIYSVGEVHVRIRLRRLRGLSVIFEMEKLRKLE